MQRSFTETEDTLPRLSRLNDAGLTVASPKTLITSSELRIPRTLTVTRDSVTFSVTSGGGPQWIHCAMYIAQAVSRHIHSAPMCDGEVIVQGDEGPVCGVAQGVHCHGVTVGHEEREEEKVEQEVESDEEKTLKERCACPWMG